jgi:hypothetical protein
LRTSTGPNRKKQKTKQNRKISPGPSVLRSSGKKKTKTFTEKPLLVLRSPVEKKKTKKHQKHPFWSFGPPVLRGGKNPKNIPKKTPSGPSVLWSPGGKKTKNNSQTLKSNDSF